MKKILLTGGNGFIGRNLLESDLAQKYRIFVPGHRELPLEDTAAVDAYFRGKEFDAVWHFATKPAHRNAPDHSNLFYTNVRMFENLARHRDRFGKFINAGSGAIYDVSANNAGVREDEIFARMGVDDHSFCKYVVAKRMENMPGFVDFNIFGIFGKYEDYAIRFISNAICKALYGLPITLRQNRRFSYLDVTDLPAVLETFTENPAQHRSYNITPPEPVELAAIADMVKKTVGNDVEIKVAASGYGLDYYGDNARLLTEFPQVRFTTFAVSVERLVKWYRENLPGIDKHKLLVDK